MFNELSTIPLANEDDIDKRILTLIDIIKVARESGFRKLRSEKQLHEILLSQGVSIQDWYLKEKNRKYMDLLLGIFIQPFLNVDEDAAFLTYDESKFHFEDYENNIPKIECLGLAAAHIHDTIAVSFSGYSLWERKKLTISSENVASKEIDKIDILNVATSERFFEEDIKLFLENLKKVELVETAIDPSDKRINLSDHHGQAELRELCNRIKHSPYVLEMKSTGWGGKRFVRKIRNNGEIELVLFKTPREYALWVKTTGRSYRETKAIAEILDERYS